MKNHINVNNMSMKLEQQSLIDEFHKNFYHRINWRKDISYLGVPILKNPLDLWSIQEIIWSNKPNVIIETGTAFGGSALFYSHILGELNTDEWGIIISVDIGLPSYAPTSYQRPQRGNIFYVNGDSGDPKTKQRVIEIIARYIESPRIMVILDSDHSQVHVARELDLFAPMVSANQHLVVEDTNTSLVLPEYDDGAGAFTACMNWMLSNQSNGLINAQHFMVDTTWRERWGFSFNEYFKRTTGDGGPC